MPKRMLTAFALIFIMSAAAEAQFTQVQGWVIVPGDKHEDNFEVRITVRDGIDAYASTTVSDTGRYMFTNLDLSVGSFDILINLEGYRESRTFLVGRSGLPAGQDFPIGRNIILIPDPASRRLADAKSAYTKLLLDEYSKGLDEVSNKRPDLAVVHLEKVATEVPEFYDAHINLGRVYQDLSRGDEAETEFRKAHELNSESAHPWIALGRLFVAEAETGILAGAKQEVVAAKLAEARAVLTEAIMLDAKIATAHLYMGDVDFRSKSYANAERELKQALELDQHLFEARFTLIYVYHDQGLWQAALDNVDTFLLENNESPYREQIAALRRRIVSHLDKRQ